MPKLDVRIPISPVPHMINRARLIAASVKEFYPDAVVTAFVGSDRDTNVTEIPGLRVQIVEPGEFSTWRNTAHPYIATMMERFKPPFHSENVVMLDADVLVMRPFDELFATDGVAAMMAHVTPFGPHHRMAWEEIFRRYNLSAPERMFEHSGWGIMASNDDARFSPVYFNTGVVFAKTTALEKICQPYFEALEFVRNNMDTYFFEQIALTLALERIKPPTTVLPLRYNFPNQQEFDFIHGDELGEVRFLHFLRTSIVDREKDFESPETIKRFISRNDLTGSNEVLRKRVEELVAPAGLAPASQR